MPMPGVVENVIAVNHCVGRLQDLVIALDTSSPYVLLNTLSYYIQYVANRVSGWGDPLQ
jgi:hypothetical protein